MRFHLRTGLTYLLGVVLVAGSLLPAGQAQALYKYDYKDFFGEVINDNPEVSFTVTGETTEPSPMNVAGYAASELSGSSWTNTTLDKPSIYNSWAVGPNGVLASSRRYPGSGSPSLYSLPLGDANIKLNGRPIKLPSMASVENATSIGNDEYLITKEYYTYLTGPNHDPIQLAFVSGASNKYYNWLTDELMVIEVDGPRYNNVSAEYQYIETWRRWKLSDLRQRQTSSVASGVRKATWNSGPGYRVSGEYATWGDGYRYAGYERTQLREDFAEINLTSRTVTYFKKDGKGTPYKTASFDNMAPFPKKTGTGTASNLSYYPGEAPDYIFKPKVMDGKGNYYNFEIDGNSKTHLIKVDGYTGMPVDLGIINLDPYASNSFESISEDGTIIGILSNWNGHDDDNGNWIPSGNETYYLHIATGSRVGKPAIHLEGFKDGYQNGYGFKTFKEPDKYWDDDEGKWVDTYRFVEKLVDMSNDVPVNTNSIYRPPANNSTPPAVITSDNQYLSQGYVYEYIPSTDQPITSNEPFTFGQLYKPSSQSIKNGTLAWSMKASLDHPNMAIGVGFRMQNNQNMYRLESNKSSLDLIKIVGGRKTLLSSTVHVVPSTEWIPYRIKLNGTTIRVYENNVKVIDITDGTFTQGTAGPFSTADNALFRNMTYQWSANDDSYATPGTAIVDTEVKYETTFNDPENDPPLTSGTEWNYAHVDTTMFLDAGDGKSGLSSLNGKTVTSTVLTFDKVGRYKIDYRLPDDPHKNHRLSNGDLAFKNYSQYSDWYSQYLIVHRRPIANFTLSVDGNKLVTWTDYSYDPDRCYSSSNCQSSYSSNHGIFKKKFYYITPSGNRVDGKLIRPVESGEYTVYMAVGDEYNAWSDWYEQTIQIDQPAQPNNPPTVTLTFPNGNYDNPSPVSLLPTVTWDQNDPDPNTIFTAFDLVIKDEWGNCVECTTNRVMETPNTSWAWTMNQSLEMGRKYQVQVRVSDGESWSGWSNIGWMSTNSPPAAYMSFPYGTQAAPTIINTLRPILTWLQTDPDTDAWFDYFQIQIINEANNTIIYHSSKVWQHTQSANGSLAVPVDLPTGQKMRVQVKVWDQYGAESPWSPQTWMMINRPPVADFDWTPKPAFEGDTVTLINRSSDPEGDSLTYEWLIVGPDYSAVYTSENAEIPSSWTDNHPGDYRVTLTVMDIHGASDSITKIVHVGDLMLDGFVRHTSQWNENRQSYNLRKTGDPERPRPYELFWSGEAFVLVSTTNEPASSVMVHMSYTELETLLTAAPNRTGWDGQMLRDDFENLPDKAYIFRFTAVWPNGHTEYVDRIISIKNPWTEFAASVRKE
ncbi:PKD domain-containing protein [Paenibacillus sp. UNC451MF]|uniref:PKD domain-containing protein n=1 Tax=Paenibacillus sp. UNC451MF TaxID=1449063 RepID=UPI00049202BE|nr:PKD domain-containing protein [Paenibacillus sp. UNC451MF]